MTTFFERRRLRKSAESLLHHARHVRRMREDVADAALVRQCVDEESHLREALRRRDWAAVSSSLERVSEVVGRLTPRRSVPWLRENLEVLLVAIAIAMGFRTYFLQPFKIPTGSMQPTLYGIHYEPQSERGLMDRPPLNLVNRAIFGRWYTEVRARASGEVVRDLRYAMGGPFEMYVIGGVAHQIDRGLQMRVEPGQMVSDGQLLASGVGVSGDHIFVDKIRWNFTRPRRGDVMVFSTSGITGLQPGIHYIKRLVGLPGEAISIEPPFLMADGVKAAGSRAIDRVQNRDVGYVGYRPTGQPTFQTADHPDPLPCRLVNPGDVLHLNTREYLGFGDNTLNSLDGRYWGPTPRENMVGPAFVVYWPISARWGLLR